jgi:hypothetical protein
MIPIGPKRFEFDNAMSGNNIPPEFHSSIEKGFLEVIPLAARSHASPTAAVAISAACAPPACRCHAPH